jgi:hypothetical protein
MLRLAWTAAALTLVATALVAAIPAASPNFPARIDLPEGFRTEGIAVGRGHSFYVGSTQTGAIYAGDLRTGTGDELVPGQTGRAAFGIFVDGRNRMWVAGGATGQAYVYDATTGEEIAGPYTLAPAAPRFINDVYVTRTGAYFTNTSAPFLYRIPIGPRGEIGGPSSVETIPLAPELSGLNGIEATPNEKTLVVVQFTTGRLFGLDPETGAAEEIVLDELVPRGDGLVLVGKTLYVVQNLPSAAVPAAGPGVVAVVELAPDLSSGEVVARLNSTADPLVNPATADRFGRLLYVVRRDVPGGTTFWLTRLDTNGT